MRIRTPAQRAARFPAEILRRQALYKVGLLRSLRNSRWRVVLVAPLVYAGFLPFALMDLFVTVHERVGFPAFGIPRLRRADYMAFDRTDLPYLNAIEKGNCFYCSYGDGVAAFLREAASRTEQYWCPIKHARRLLGQHERYPRFVEFGDAQTYREGLERLRRQYELPGAASGQSVRCPARKAALAPASREDGAPPGPGVLEMNRLALLLLALPLAAAAAPPVLKEVARIHVGGEARWDYLTVDSAMHRLYVSHASVTEVIDTRTNKVVGSIADTAGVHGIAIAADLGRGFISDGRANAVTVFDLKTLKTTATIAVGTNPDAILYDPASRRVMTFNGRSHDVTIVDAASGAVLATVPVGGKPEFAQLGANGEAWFNVEDTDEMAVLDPKSARLVRRMPLAPCHSPSGLAVDDRQRLYAVCENQQMVVVGADAKVLARPTIGAGPDGVAWMDGAAFSANGQDGTISVIDTTTGRFETIATVSSAPAARTIAADPATHRLYLPSADMQPAGAGERRVGVPGSFYVLVLERAN